MLVIIFVINNGMGYFCAFEMCLTWLYIAFNIRFLNVNLRLTEYLQRMHLMLSCTLLLSLMLERAHLNLWGTRGLLVSLLLSVNFPTCTWYWNTFNRYYHNITANTLVVLEAMATHNVKTLIYSSTCATYGEPEKMPITEETPQASCCFCNF